MLSIEPAAPDLVRALLESQAQVAALTAQAKALDDEATMLATHDLATTEQVLRAVRVERDAARRALAILEDR